MADVCEPCSNEKSQVVGKISVVLLHERSSYLNYFIPRVAWVNGISLYINLREPITKLIFVENFRNFCSVFTQNTGGILMKLQTSAVLKQCQINRAYNFLSYIFYMKSCNVDKKTFALYFSHCKHCLLNLYI